MSTQIVRTRAGSRLPMAIECSAEASIRQQPAPLSASR
jgi:hypothetical protein